MNSDENEELLKFWDSKESFGVKSGSAKSAYALTGHTWKK